ncbi:MAG: glycosyltransferase [Chloroflexi bacterium]|nr:glycosyltransferase [Chloroflexota bacterium]
MRILHIITSLDAGGAQWVLINILEQLKAKGVDQCLISMKPNGELAQQVIDLGISLHEISFSPGTFIEATSRVNEIIASFQPQVIQSWMYHGDFLTIFLRNPDHIPIIWGVHHSYEHFWRNRMKFFTKIIARINAACSHIIPNQIICCSHSAMKSHARIGYAASKMIHIPNGIAAERFIPDPQARNILRQELGLAPQTRLVGYIARYHPQKDHALFFLSANLFLVKNKDVHFILVGEQVIADNPEIKRWMTLSKTPENFHFLGKRTDLPMITAALDLATLTSSGEAFPLTIIEAMACEIPCVATDVGDVKLMLGASGTIVPPQNPKALSEGWHHTLNKSADERTALGKSLRERVIKDFTNQAMAEQYLQVYIQIISS